MHRLGNRLSCGCRNLSNKWQYIYKITNIKTKTTCKLVIYVARKFWRAASFPFGTHILYRIADKSLAQPGRKQANVSVRMAWISFGALPCKKTKKNLMTALVSMLLKSRASPTCLRSCSLPGRAKDISAPRLRNKMQSTLMGVGRTVVPQTRRQTHERRAYI